MSGDWHMVKTDRSAKFRKRSPPTEQPYAGCPRPLAFQCVGSGMGLFLIGSIQPSALAAVAGCQTAVPSYVVSPATVQRTISLRPSFGALAIDRQFVIGPQEIALLAFRCAGPCSTTRDRPVSFPKAKARGGPPLTEAAPYFRCLSSVDTASFSQSSTTRSHACLSSGLIALSACSRASSACFRYLAASSDMGRCALPYGRRAGPMLLRGDVTQGDDVLRSERSRSRTTNEIRRRYRRVSWCASEAHRTRWPLELPDPAGLKRAGGHEPRCHQMGNCLSPNHC
jgi:hypothetical protein